MSDTYVEPPRPGYNRDGWKDGKPIAPPPDPTFLEHDPIIVNWPMVGRVAAVLGVLGSFWVPVSIIVWRIAL